MKLRRFALLLCVGLYPLFSVLDFWMVPETIGKIFLVRFAVALPFFLGMYLLSFTQFFFRHYRIILGIVSVTGGFFLLWMIALSSPGEPGYHYYFSGLFLLLTGIPLLFRLPTPDSLISGGLVIIGYGIMVLGWQGAVRDAASGIVFINNVTFLTVAWGIAVLGNVFFFRSLRNEYNNRLEINKTNQQLKELDKSRSEFFANISHELRTPLTLILGPVEAFIAGEYGDTLHREDGKVKSIWKNGLRLLKLINHLLDIIKIEADRMPVKPMAVDVGKMIHFFLSLVEEGAEVKKIKIFFRDKINLPGNPPFVTALDPDLFEKIFFNLVSNALKFAPRGGRIIIRLNRREPDNFRLTVSDNGIGIPEEKLSLIFDRFTQVNSASTRAYEGSGIGLAFVKDLVKLMGGSIGVKSRFRRGTRFLLTLPVREPGDSVPVEEFPEVPAYLRADFPSPGKSRNRGGAPVYHPFQEDIKTILVVEDNDDMCRFLGELLKKEYIVMTAENGINGLAKAELSRPDLIITDLMMPEMDGCEFLKAVKKSSSLKGVPVIMLTARAEMEMRLHGLEQGADDYLSKPFNPRELLARVKSALEMKSLRDEMALQNELLKERKGMLEHLVRKQVRVIEKEKDHALANKLKAERQLEDFLLVLASAIESKDSYTGGHVERVAYYSRDLASRLGLPEEHIREIYLGAIVHDVGKIGVRDSVLNKPGMLEPWEWEELKKHPAIGRKLLSRIADIPTALSIVYCHQERWDGTGYPRGLKGESIPLAARIVTIADYWDAIITDRPYRKAFPMEDALEIIRNERGLALDPGLLDIFLDETTGIFRRYL